MFCSELSFVLRVRPRRADELGTLRCMREYTIPHAGLALLVPERMLPALSLL